MARKTPEWSKVRTWLESHPLATHTQIQDQFEVSVTVAFRLLKRWRMESESGESSVNLKAIREKKIESNQIATMSRDTVVGEMKAIHSNIRLVNRRFAAEAEDMIPAHMSQLALTLSHLTKAAQTLADSFPGLASVAMIDDTSGHTEASLDRDLAEAHKWLNIAS